jgi:putative transposase
LLGLGGPKQAAKIATRRFSRKVVVWEVHEQECGKAAAALVQRAVLAEHCLRRPLALYADNGSPMNSQTLQAKL